MKLSSSLHLHKCLSGAYTVILAAVPPCAGECRFVRVASVLIFTRALPALSTTFTTIRPTAIAALATAIIGTLLNDGGVSV